MNKNNSHILIRLHGFLLLILTLTKYLFFHRQFFFFFRMNILDSIYCWYYSEAGLRKGALSAVYYDLLAFFVGPDSFNGDPANNILMGALTAAADTADS